MLGNSSVWDRTETDDNIVTDQIYQATIGGVLLWGFVLNYLTVTMVPVEMILSVPFWILLGGYFVSVIAGTIVFQKSDNPGISFLGYNLIVVPVGIVITPFVHSFEPNLVAEAMMVTGGVTGLMMFLGMVYPAFFLSIGRALFVSLLCVIIIELGMSLIFGIQAGVMDWIVAVLFCGYIGYDWARANQIPKTLDNAVDSAASLYLDIINLFIRILRIMGRR
jgi:FtsH-binding integral membrane protein